MTGISDAGLIRQLRNRFGIRGTAEMQLEDNVLPTVNLGDLDSAPWNSKSGGIASVFSGPIAAQLSYVGLRVPLVLPPNFRAVVRRIGVSRSVAGSSLVKIFNSAVLDALLAAPTVGVVSGTWDSPAPDQPKITSGLQVYSTNNAAAAGGDGFRVDQSLLGQVVLVEGPWSLAPGNTLFIQDNVVNSLLVGSFYWDEYYIG